IEILKPPPADRFSAPSIDSIRLKETASILKLGRHIAKGIVIAVWQRGDFAVRTDNGSIVNVRLAEGSPPSYGDRVEVVGLPDTDLYRINLRRAIWRKTPGTSRYTPEKATPTNAEMLFTDGKGHNELKPDFHGQAISIQGTVFGSHSDIMDNGIVRLLCNGFSVTIDSSASPSAIAALQPGCKARISGTCIVKTDSWHPNEPLPRIQEVILVVRNASDIEILEPPPWWTPQRFAILISALFATLMAFLLWNVLLRRLAEKRGRELMQSKLSQVETELKVQERTRIAVELHDTIAQNLTGVSLEIDSAEQLATKNPEGMMQHLGMAARTLQSCRNELRNCLWDLRSRALEEANLNEAIRRAIAPQISNVELSIRFNVQRKHLTDDTAHVLMRIIRELVLNAVRHGEASSVKIAGSLENGDTLLFSVSDDGCGFDPQTRPGVAQGHFGLQGVRERVNQFDGEMNIESTPGKGSRISILMKLSNQT
ncbi:MAG: sensor histidine kinase, partial [Kiritimatiellae bacterium]|nr:sensor histidine kinase [Kiritimatiellia bacterium]